MGQLGFEVESVEDLEDVLRERLVLLEPDVLLVELFSSFLKFCLEVLIVLQ